MAEKYRKLALILSASTSLIDVLGAGDKSSVAYCHDEETYLRAVYAREAQS